MYCGRCREDSGESSSLLWSKRSFSLYTECAVWPPTSIVLSSPHLLSTSLVAALPKAETSPDSRHSTVEASDHSGSLTQSCCGGLCLPGTGCSTQTTESFCSVSRQPFGKGHLLDLVPEGSRSRQATERPRVGGPGSSGFSRPMCRSQWNPRWKSMKEVLPQQAWLPFLIHRSGACLQSEVFSLNH